MVNSAAVIVAAVASAPAAHAIHVFPNPGSLPTTIPASCRAALSANVVCEPDFITPDEFQNSVAFNETFLGLYCQSSCASALNSWSEKIKASCGSKVYDFGAGSPSMATEVSAPIQWAHNVSCLTDPKSKKHCLPDISNGTISACADCTLQYYGQMAGSKYGIEGFTGKDFTSLASSCKVDPTKYLHGTKPPAPSIKPTPVPIPQCQGASYTVKSGDTCESIAKAKSLAIDNFRALNSLDPKCHQLVVGADVCVDGACKLYTIKETDTCKVILRGQSFSEVQLKSWNPVIGGNCKDLSPLAGHSICLSPPGSPDYTTTSSIEFNSTWTLPPGSWTPAPTKGTDFNTTQDAFPIQTSSATANITAGAAYKDYIKYCPIAGDDLDRGFSWDYLDEDCVDLLDPYCHPMGTGPTPTSTTFPSSCMPAYWLPVASKA